MKYRQPLLLFVLLLFAHAAAADVTIQRTEPVIERRHFDPKNPPAEMPKLHKSEAALTQSYFAAESRVGGQVIKRDKSADGCRSTIKIDTVKMTVRLRITIWLPEGAYPKLVNHEEGHRQIAEHYYEDAEKIARKYAEQLIGQEVSGTAKDCDAAGDIALKRTAEELGGRYLGETDVPSGKAHEIYDQLTEHGTNAVKEDRAVEEAKGKIEQQK